MSWAYVSRLMVIQGPRQHLVQHALRWEQAVRGVDLRVEAGEVCGIEQEQRTNLVGDCPERLGVKSSRVARGAGDDHLRARPIQPGRDAHLGGVEHVERLGEIGVGLPDDQIHAPNEKVEIPLLLKGAEVALEKLSGELPAKAGAFPPCTADGSKGVAASDQGSIIIVVGTDAPLMHDQLDRVAKRAAMGLARLGSYSGNSSGDLIVSFSTAAAEVNHEDQDKPDAMAPVPNAAINPIFEGTVQATEEAIVNALVAARTMTGINGARYFGLPHDEVRDILKRYNRLESPAK